LSGRPTVISQLGLVLLLQLFQPSHLGWQQTVVFLFQIEVGRLADAGLAADISHRHAVSAMLQNERLLGVRKSRCFRRSPLLPTGKSARKTLPKNDPVSRPQSKVTPAVVAQVSSALWEMPDMVKC
jgi:hypothetical protein